MSDIRYGACIEVSTDKEVDCDDSPSDVHIVIDGTADKDSRYEKETRIDGRDRDEDYHNYSSSSERQYVSDTVVSFMDVFGEKYAFEHYEKQKSELREKYDAINMVFNAYQTLFDKKIDGALAVNYQKLTWNFKYSSYRVEQAQRRYLEFMQGKKFKISTGDREILDKISKMNNLVQIQKNAKQLQSIAKVFKIPGYLFSAKELLDEFNQAQRTKNWQSFGVKISALGADMIIGSLTALAISVSSIPVALVVATLGVIASHYFADESFWRDFQNNIKGYLQ